MANVATLTPLLVQVGGYSYHDILPAHFLNLSNMRRGVRPNPIPQVYSVPVHCTVSGPACLADPVLALILDVDHALV
jgi:hypothetical protein